MAYLNFIKDEDLNSILANIINIGIQKRITGETDFEKKVIGPFSSIIESCISNIDHQRWRELEMIRQVEKSLQNHIGEMHQKVVGAIEGSIPT